jgi:hypothetical protein
MPEYLHPSISSRIIDKSFTFATAQGATTGFFAFFSSIGEDNVVKKITSPEEFIYYYDEPNFKNSGQMPLNIIRWLRSAGEALCLRLLPDDATIAHTVVALRVKDVGGALEAETVKVTLVTPAVNKSALENAVDAIKGTVDGDGFSLFPLFAVTPRGRGKAYNSRGWKLSPLSNLDDTYTSFRVFELEFTERLSNGAEVTLGGPYKVALNPEAMSINRESLHISEVVAKYDDNFNVMFFEDQYDALATVLGVNPDLVDFVSNSSQIIAGLEVDPFADVNMTWYNATNATSPDFINMSRTTQLSDGVDGDMSAASQESLLTKAYNGEIDPSITDKKIYEIDVILDANTSPSVKNAMVALSRDIRRDCVSILDTQLTGTYQQAIDYRRDKISFSTFYAAIFGQDFVVYDEYSGRNVKVTSTYFLADKIPSVDDRFGIQYPFVGPRRGVISGFEHINWVPTEPQKEDLYKAQVNYVERDPRQTAFGSQLTSQLQTSALSNLSSVRTLLRIQRTVEAVSRDYPFEFNDSETASALNDALNSAVQVWVTNRACEYINVSVYASAYDKQQKVLRIRIDLKFTGIVERILADIIVNK